MKVTVLKMGRRYYTGMMADRQTVYAFKNYMAANTCKQFLEHHRAIHGSFPRVVPGKDWRVLPELGAPVLRDESLDRLQKLCRLGGMGLFGIHEFEYTIQRNATHIKLRGEDFEDTLGLETNPAEVLEVLFKIE